MAEAAVSWRLEGDSAYLACGAIEARVDFSRDGERLRLSAWQDCPSADAVFFALGTSGILGASPEGALPLEHCERYVRGRDLFAMFPKSSPRGLTHELYWRATYHADVHAAQVELIYSVRTDLLDSDPKSWSQSIPFSTQAFHTDDLNATAFQELTPGAPALKVDPSSPNHLFVFRNGSLQSSYAEMVHPSDFVSTCVQHNAPPWSIVSSFFPERLEKGVIRRARICGWFLPAENDLEVAVELARRFVNEPPPLTT